MDPFATKDGVPVQDLQADDFEIVEDNAPQKIGTFEHVVIDPAHAGERIDPASLSAGGIHCSIQYVLLSLRMHNDTAHLDFRQAPSEKEVWEWMETVGRQFRPPVAVGLIQKQGAEAPVQLPPRRLPNVIESTESISGIGDAANIWRGYDENTRGVITFRRGRFVGQLNAPSVEDATVVAKGLVSLLNP